MVQSNIDVNVQYSTNIRNNKYMLIIYLHQFQTEEIVKTTSTKAKEKYNMHEMAQLRIVVASERKKETRYGRSCQFVFCITSYFVITYYVRCLKSANTAQQRNTMRHTQLRHWRRDQMAAIFQSKFSDAFSWMKIDESRISFRWSLFLGAQLTIFQHFSGYGLAPVTRQAIAWINDG